MKLFAVFGNPIQHSLSPLMHNWAFGRENRSAFYLPVSCAPNDLLRKLEAFRELGGAGANLTRPLKELIVPHLHRASSWVSSTGAANVLHWAGDGWEGENTDVQALIQALPPSRGLYGRRALILGMGGVARATLVALQTLEYDVTVMARRPDRIAWDTSAIGWKWEVLRAPRYDVVVNATPIGQIGEMAWPFEPVFDPGTVVADWVYRPNVTAFMRSARASGAICVDGLSLLVKQAALSWVSWFGAMGPESVMREAVKDYYAE
jgi:shikimate dehydrogenase